MAVAYRLFQARFGPCDSTGARLVGGRWNSPGRDALYASDSLALCALEVLVHIRDPRVVPAYHYCKIDIPEMLIEPWPEYMGHLRHQALLESEVLSREFGDEFLGNERGFTLAELAVRLGTGIDPPERPVQAVPSAIVPWDAHVNYLINPLNAHFSKLQWGASRPFRFDSRLLNPSLR